MAETSKGRYIDIHTHGARPRADVICVKSLQIGDVGIAKSQQAGEHIISDLQILKANQQQLFSVGIYPFDARKASEERFTELEKVARDGSIFAIGETGLDYREQYKPSAAHQVETFERQVDIADRIVKPLIIHQVRALDDTLRILRSATVPVIFHGFSGSTESATRILNESYYLSFGHLLFVSDKVRNSLRSAPLDRIFLETDDSDRPIEEIYAIAAEIMNIPLNILILRIEQNFESVRECGMVE